MKKFLLIAVVAFLPVAGMAAEDAALDDLRDEVAELREQIESLAESVETLSTQIAFLIDLNQQAYTELSFSLSPGMELREADNTAEDEPDALSAESFIQSQECDGETLDKRYFVICYSTDAKVAYWVGYILTPANLEGSASRTDDFREDTLISADYRSTLSDYRRSGYDRGHLAPAASFKRSEEAMSTTFLMSNMAPQTPYLNRNIWNQLESAIRSLAGSEQFTVVFTGNVFSDASKTIGNNVTVPDSCYKVILHVGEQGEITMYAYQIPNVFSSIKPYQEYKTTVDEVEEAAGIDFFAELPDQLENELEASLNDLSS